MKVPTSTAKALRKALSKTVLNKSYIVDSGVKKRITQASTYARGVVLDVGAGDSPYKELITSQAEVTKYISLEYPGSTDYFGERIDSVDIFADAQALPVKSESIDTVLCTEVMEHVPEPVALVNELWRVLKKDGILILTAPSTFPLHLEPNDYYRFTKHGLRYMLEKPGFSILQIQNCGGPVATIGQMTSLYLNEAWLADPKTKQPKPYLAPFVLPICGFIQLCTLAVDRFTKSQTLTLDHTVIARK